jgi:hypothetical protein
MASTSVWCIVPWLMSLAAVVGCGHSGGPAPAPASPAVPAPGFRSVECNGVTDADIVGAISSPSFTRVVVSDVGCFWQEDTALGTPGMGMGISTWWYRGSDMDTERKLEQRAGRTLTELAIDGNKGFKAADKNACSVYVAKGQDVITWSIQTLNPSKLPNLCTVTERLAQLSQDRVN